MYATMCNSYQYFIHSAYVYLAIKLVLVHSPKYIIYFSDQLIIRRLKYKRKQAIQLGLLFKQNKVISDPNLQRIALILESSLNNYSSESKHPVS